MGHSNISDICYDLCVIDPLTKKFPLAEIAFLTSSRCHEIVESCKGVQRIINFDRHGKDKGLSNSLRFISNLKKERFDLAVVLKDSWIHKFTGIRSRWRITKQVRQQFKHPVDRYLYMLRSHGMTLDGAVFHFSSQAQDDTFCKEYLGKKGIKPEDRIVGILPFATWFLKIWPMDKWNYLTKVLREQYGIKVMNIGKMPNNNKGRRLAGQLSPQIIDTSDTSLSQAKALLKRCCLFIGPDSSLLHLASCMGVETIGLYGATSSEHFYPYFHRHNIVWSKSRLSCMPCYPGPKPGWYCSKGKVNPDYGPCMEEINVEDVLDVIKQRLHLT